ALPHVVVAAAEAQAVLRGGTRLRRRAARHDRPVEQHRLEQELVDRRPLVLAEPLARPQWHHAATQLSRRLGVQPPQEVARAVWLVLVDERRAVAGEAV